MKYILLIYCTLLLGCNHGNRGQWTAEVALAEQEFNDLAQEEGLAVAFSQFAAPDGVIRRQGSIIKGPEAIAKWYQENGDPQASLSWEPDFIDVSASGDLAYTYGGYVYTSLDSLGQVQESTGTFHTVWKRQSDGSWKFVWD